MINIAFGYACSFNDLLVRFPFEKYKSLMTKWRTKVERIRIIKKVFIKFLHLIILDIIENNVTFVLPGIGLKKAEMHMERIKGKDFEIAQKAGKFKDVDFLESLFTGYLIFLYVNGKSGNTLTLKKIPIYINKKYRDILTKYTNQGRSYC